MMTSARIVGVAAIFVVCAWFSQTVAAQDASIDSDIEVLRANIRAEKMQLVTNEMQLSANDAKGFWPIYREYDAGLTKLNDEKVDLLKEYAKHYDNLTKTQV